MKALSVRAPWWWYILHGQKDIENRDWATDFRGRVLIHASKWWSGSAVLEEIRAIDQMTEQEVIAPRLSDLMPLCGHLVGSVEIVACVRQHNSRWFFGRCGFVLRNPVAFDRSIPFKGALGFFDVPDGMCP